MATTIIIMMKMKVDGGRSSRHFPSTGRNPISNAVVFTEVS